MQCVRKKENSLVVNQIILFINEKFGMAEDSQSLLAKQDTKSEDSSKAVYVRDFRWRIVFLNIGQPYFQAPVCLKQGPQPE